MGFIFKIIRTLIVPLIAWSFLRSFLNDMLRSGRSGYGGGNGGSWNSSNSYNSSNSSNSYSGSSQSKFGRSRSPWDVLGLPRSATNAEIRTRYHELIAKYHPDKFAGLNDAEFSDLATKKFREIRDAYEQIKRSRGF